MTRFHIFAALMAQVLALPALAEPVKITLLGVGDVYNFAGSGTQGGFARLNAVARAERAANPNLLYLFDGDMLSPSLLSGFDKGQNTIDLTNLVPFDLAVPGNHEFDFGVKNFTEKMAASNYPWAAINITNADGSAFAGLGGVTVKEVAGVKVALIPVAQDTSPEVSSTGDLVFGDTVETAIAAAKQARADGADLVVGVVQTDITNDLKLVRSHAFDVVLSGDDHSYGTSYDGVTAFAGLGGVTVKEVAGVKVALIPVAQDTSPEVSSTGDLVFGDTVETAIAAAKKARADGADLVVGVVQTDITNDLKLVRSHAFDVVLSGDDHSYGTSYDGVTAYVETSVDARHLAPLDLLVDVSEKDGKRTVKWTPTFRFIDTAMVAPDPETQAKVDAYQAGLDKTLDVEIGVTETAMDSRRNVVRGEESAMGNLIADAMRAATGADVAIMNGGGIRADRTYDAGTRLTRRDILTELPFGNVTQLTAIPGSQLLAALENGLSQVEKGAGRFPQVSGLTLVYDPSAEPGARIASVLIGGAELELDKLYKVAVNDFILGGGDGYSALGGGQLITDTGAGALVAADVMAYVEKQGTVKPEVEGRISLVGGP